MTAATTAKPTTNPTTPKVDTKKALAAVMDRQAKKEHAEVLEGTVISTGADVAEADAGTGRAVRAAVMTGRVARGMWTAPGAFKDWRLATEFDSKVMALELAGEHAKAVVTLTAQLAESEKRRTRARNIAREVAILTAPVVGGGWFWATLALGVLMAGSLAMLKVKAMHGKVPARLAEAFAVSLALEVVAAALGIRPAPIILTNAQVTILIAAPIVTALILIFAFDKVSIKTFLYVLGLVEFAALATCWHGLHPAWSKAYMVAPLSAFLPTLIYAIYWAIKATKDDGTIANDLRGVEAMVPVEVTGQDAPPVVQAILEAGKLPKETAPMLVSPGVTWPRPGILWTAAVDLGGLKGGPSAKRFLSGSCRHDLAAHLGLGDETMLVTVDRKRGSRLHVTGVVGDPWAELVPSPLLRLDPVDTWKLIPFGTDINGIPVTYRIPGVHSLFGGGTGGGKSTAMANVWCAFALNPMSKIRVIDGGEDDTSALDKTGLATAWTNERAEGIEILHEVRAEMNRRQHLLALAGDDKEDFGATPEWMADNGIGHDLLAVDELPTFTQDKSDEAKEFATLLTEILQRSRKTGMHVLLSAQSPSVGVIDSDSRSIVAHRWAGRARDPELAAKILGSGTVGRGVDPRNLPQDIEGLGWYSTLTGDTVMRPHYLSRRERRLICERGVALRKGSTFVSAADEDRVLASRVSALVREHGTDVTAGRVMLARDVATRLEIEQMELRASLGRIGVGTQKVSRPDDVEAHGRMHYVLSDLPITRLLGSSQ